MLSDAIYRRAWWTAIVFATLRSASSQYSNRRSPFTHDQKAMAAVLKEPICSNVSHSYEWLISAQLSQWTQYNVTFNATSLQAGMTNLTSLIYIKNNTIYMGASGSNLQRSMVGDYLRYLKGLSVKARLPDLVLMIHGEDEPHGKHIPVFAFCRRSSSHNDLLLPNLVEEGNWERILPDQPQESRAGPGDPRQAKVIWYGRPHAWHRKDRKLIVQAGIKNPDKIHAGITDWRWMSELEKRGREDEWGRYWTVGQPQQDWANHYKYQLNVPGVCSSSRLAFQLYTDATVFLVASEDQEWFTPLLRPYVHYIPVHAEGRTDRKNATAENILAQIEWAESNPDLVKAIDERSTEFALTHLRPGTGRDCYTLMLLHAYAYLMDEEIIVPESAEVYGEEDVEEAKEAREFVRGNW